jgi:DNA-directed RNA polymerase subunit omega
MPMFSPLKGDEIVQKVGGRFKLTALVQQRIRELMEGARPLIERHGRTDLEVAIEEVSQGKITIDLASPSAATAEAESP